MNGAQLGTRGIEIRAGRQPPEQLRHAMHPAIHHRGRQMVRAGDDVCDDLGFRRIRDGRFENAHDGGGSIAEPDDLADHGRIAL